MATSGSGRWQALAFNRRDLDDCFGEIAFDVVAQRRKVPQYGTCCLQHIPVKENRSISRAGLLIAGRQGQEDIGKQIGRRRVARVIQVLLKYRMVCRRIAGIH